MSNSLKNSYIHHLQSKPSFSKAKSYQWADYIELLCLANTDGELSEYDIIDRFSERERDLYEADQEDIEEMEELEKEEGFTTRRSEISDRWKIVLSDWFKVLELRQSLYGVSYPFTVTNNEIKKKSGALNLGQRLYVYFLLCSNLYLFDSSTRIKLTGCFEIISAVVFKNILPLEAQVHVFGSNPFNVNGRYKSSLALWDRINLLAEDLNEVVDSRILKEDYLHKGDDGLDLVAWIPTGDELPSSIVFFAQCACTVKWVSKQLDSSYDSWKGKINFKNHILNSIFIPFCYRKGDGTWFKIGNIRQSFLIDRKRLIHYYLQKESNVFDDSPAFIIVNEIINAREGVF